MEHTYTAGGTSISFIFFPLLLGLVAKVVGEIPIQLVKLITCFKTLENSYDSHLGPKSCRLLQLVLLRHRT